VSSEVVGCTQADCPCECFLPGQTQIRSCDRCAHGWVLHGLFLCEHTILIVFSKKSWKVSKISGIFPKFTGDFPPFCNLNNKQGYRPLLWTLISYRYSYRSWSEQDEVVTLHQFLRFGETKSIVELMAEEQQIRPETHRNPAFKLRHKPPSRTHHFENLPGGSLAFLQPFHYVSASVFPPSPAVECHPSTQKLQRLSKRNNGSVGGQFSSGQTKPAVQFQAAAKSDCAEDSSGSCGNNLSFTTSNIFYLQYMFLILSKIHPCMLLL
uniref:Uncharacterized protein n=1 Tax=Sinocyclocheilus rhinocerous TaxID=307959 RepID=A0A673GMQ1_9TELE